MTTRELSRAAQAALLIRADMKSEYPDLKVNVTCKNYAGGDHVRVVFYDQPPEVVRHIESLLHKYEYATYDPNEDLWGYGNWNDKIPQTKYLFVENNRSAEMDDKLLAFALSLYGEGSKYTASYEIHTTMYRLFTGAYAGFWETTKQENEDGNH